MRHPDQAPVPPADQSLPEQEQGVRPARALPYELNVRGVARPSDGSFRIEFLNTGRAAAVFQVRSGNGPDAPRSYTVESHKQVSDVWNIMSTGAFDYDLSVYGPNGFFRGFKGGVAGPRRATLDVRAVYDTRRNGIALMISNRATQDARVSILDKYTGQISRRTLDAGESWSKDWSLARMSGWYDFVITVDGDDGFAYQLAGHIENGEDSISDPAMGGLV